MKLSQFKFKLPEDLVALEPSYHRDECRLMVIHRKSGRIETNKKDENGGKYSLKQAIYIIENIYRENEENHFYELIPSWHQALKDSLEVLQTAEPSRAIADYIDDCNYLLENMPLLQLHLTNCLMSK